MHESSHYTICTWCKNQFFHRHITKTNNCFCNFTCYKLWKKDKPNIYNHSKNAHIVLTNKQKQFIVGTLLGDAYMGFDKRGKFPHLEISQSIKQYCIWKNYILKSLLPSKPYKVIHHSIWGTFHSWRFRVPSHPKFLAIYNIFYNNKRKYIDKKIFKFLTPFAIAVWFMDDGSTNGGALRISTNCFSYKEHLILQHFFINKYKIESTIVKDKRCNSHYIFFPKQESIKLRKLIKPFIIPCMKYKLIFQ